MDSAIVAEQPATAKLAELEAALAEAEARVQAVEAERRRAMRELAKVEAPLRDYWEQVGAGEREQDPALERELAEAVRDARSTAIVRPTVAATNSAQVSGIELVDQAIEAKLAGANRAAEERRRELRDFLSNNGDLVAEWTAEAEQVRAACQEAWAKLAEPLRQWQRLAVRWGPFCEVNGIERAELPVHPLAGLDRDPARQGIAIPAPASLLPAADQGP